MEEGVGGGGEKRRGREQSINGGDEGREEKRAEEKRGTKGERKSVKRIVWE